jgi:hypothetical protein
MLRVTPRAGQCSLIRAEQSPAGKAFNMMRSAFLKRLCDGVQVSLAD